MRKGVIIVLLSLIPAPATHAQYADGSNRTSTILEKPCGDVFGKGIAKGLGTANEHR
jgi:hypothetical protein